MLVPPSSERKSGDPHCNKLNNKLQSMVEWTKTIHLITKSHLKCGTSLKLEQEIGAPVDSAFEQGYQQNEKIQLNFKIFWFSNVIYNIKNYF